MSSRRKGTVVRLAVFMAALLSVCMFLALQPNKITVFRFSKMGTTVTDTCFISRTADIAIAAPPNATVYYTTDGSTPDENAQQYTQPIVLQPASGDFPNCLLLKAIAFYADGTKSQVLTHTLWAHTRIQEQFQSLLLSISADPTQLTDGPNGILYGENVWLRGAESEREIYLEAVSSSGREILNQKAGARVYGMLSRRGSIQSLKLYARKTIDGYTGKFDFDVFGSLGYDGQIIDRYDRLVVRNSSNSEYDFWCGFIRDVLNQQLAEQAGYTDYQRAIPAVAYINGEYYGFFWLHENYCDDFLKQKYGKGKGHFEVIEGSELEKTVDESDPLNAAAAREFNRLYQRLAYSDLTDEKNFAELNAFIDVESYLKNFAFNIYINNVDWPHNNYKCYRYYPSASEPYGTGALDGKWRFLYHDLDYTMGNYGRPESSAQYNILRDIMSADHTRYCPLFTNLMKREDCKTFFLSEIVRLRDGALSAQNVIDLKTMLVEEREHEMQRFFVHLSSLETTTGSVSDANNAYAKSLQRIDDFILNRAQYLQIHLIETFALPEDYFG